MKNKIVKQMMLDCAVGTDHVQIGADGAVVNDRHWPTINGRSRSAKDIRAWVEFARNASGKCQEFPYEDVDNGEISIAVGAHVDAFDVVIFSKIYLGINLLVQKTGLVEYFIGTKHDIHLVQKAMLHFFKYDVLYHCPSSKPGSYGILTEKMQRLYKHLRGRGWQIEEGIYSMLDVYELQRQLNVMSPERSVDIIITGSGLKLLDVPNSLVNMLS